MYSSDYYYSECHGCGKKNRVPFTISIGQARCGYCQMPLDRRIFDRLTGDVSIAGNISEKSFYERYQGLILFAIVVSVIAFVYFLAAQPRDTFDQPAQALPTSGVKSTTYSKINAIAPFEIITKSGSDYHFYIKLYNWNTDRLAATVFVRAGDRVEFDVPVGSYELKYATGKTWYGLEHLFGPDTGYLRADEMFNFTRSGDRVAGWSVELYRQVGGNLETERISEDEF